MRLGYTSKKKEVPKKYGICYSIIHTVNGATNNDQAADNLTFPDVPMLILKKPRDADDEYVVRKLVERGKNVFLYTYLGTVSGRPLLTNAQLQADIDYFNSLGANTFLDQFGYDFTTTRDQQLFAVNYIHGIGRNLIANCWLIDDCFGQYPDYYPQFSTTTKFNASNAAALNPAVLQSGDFYMLESFGVTYTGYRDTTGILGDISRAIRAKSFADKYGFDILPLSYPENVGGVKENAEIDKQRDIDFAYKLASFFNLKWWSVNNPTLAAIYTFNPSGASKIFDNAADISQIGVVSSDYLKAARSFDGVTYTYTTGVIAPY